MYHCIGLEPFDISIGTEQNAIFVHAKSPNSS